MRYSDYTIDPNVSIDIRPKRVYNKRADPNGSKKGEQTMKHPLVIVTKDGAEALREAKRFVCPVVRYSIALDLYLVYEDSITAEGGEDCLTFSV